MAFEALESRTAQAGMRHIANCDVSIDGLGGRGIFDAEANVVADGLVESTGPQVQVLAALYPDVAHGTDVLVTKTVDGITTFSQAYTVSGIQPDGTGFLALQLREAG